MEAEQTEGTFVYTQAPPVSWGLLGIWLPQWPPKSPLASGFLITRVEGGFSGHLGSAYPSALVHLDSFHECLTWDSVLKSGTIQRSPARFLFWAQFAPDVVTRAPGEMGALGPWDPDILRWPHTSDTRNRLFCFTPECAGFLDLGHPTLWRTACQFQQMGLLVACQLARGKKVWAVAQQRWTGTVISPQKETLECLHKLLINYLNGSVAKCKVAGNLETESGILKLAVGSW